MTRLPMILNSAMISFVSMMLFPAASQGALITYYNGEEVSGPLTDHAGGQMATAVGSGHVYAQPSAPAGTYGAITLTSGLGGAYGTTASGNPRWDMDAAGSSELGGLVNNFTSMAWVFMPSGGVGDDWPRIIGNHDFTAGQGWTLGVRNKGGISNAPSLVGIGVQGFYSPDDSVANDDWYHIAATKSDTTGVTIFVNGIEVFNDTSPNALMDWIATADTFSLGSIVGDLSINGMLIDEIRVYDSVLDANAIIAAAQVPEPQSLLLWSALGLLGLGYAVWRRSRKS